MGNRSFRLLLCLRTYLAITLLVAAACSQPGGAITELVEHPAIETETDTVILQVFGDSVRGSVVATYTNRTSSAVYLDRCGGSYPGFTLEKESGGKWLLGYAVVCMLGGASPLEVRPGESRTDTLPLWDSRAPNTLPRFQSQEFEGTYRIVYTAYDCCSTRPGEGVRYGARLPKEEHVSKAFTIRVSR